MKITRAQAFVVLLLATYLPYLVGVFLHGNDRLNWFKYSYLLPFALLGQWTSRTGGIIIIPILWLALLILLAPFAVRTRTRLVAVSIILFVFNCVTACLTYNAFLA